MDTCPLMVVDDELKRSGTPGGSTTAEPRTGAASNRVVAPRPSADPAPGDGSRAFYAFM